MKTERRRKHAMTFELGRVLTEYATSGSSSSESRGEAAA